MIKKPLINFLITLGSFVNAVNSIIPSYCIIKKDTTYYCVHSYYSNPNITYIDTSIEKELPALDLPNDTTQLPPIPQDSIHPSVTYKIEKENDWPNFIAESHCFISCDTKIHSILLCIPDSLQKNFQQGIPTTYSQYFTHFLLDYLKHEPSLTIALTNNFFSNGQQEIRIGFIESCLENNIPLYINNDNINNFLFLLNKTNKYADIKTEDDAIKLLYNHIQKINKTRSQKAILPLKTINNQVLTNTKSIKKSPLSNLLKSWIEQTQEYFKQKLPQFTKPIIYISAFILLVSIRAIFLYSFNLTQEPHS